MGHGKSRRGRIVKIENKEDEDKERYRIKEKNTKKCGEGGRERRGRGSMRKDKCMKIIQEQRQKKGKKVNEGKMNER